MDLNQANKQKVLAAMARRQQQTSGHGPSSSAVNENQPPLQHQRQYNNYQQQPPYPMPANLQLPYSRPPAFQHPLPPPHDYGPRPSDYQRPNAYPTNQQQQFAYSMGNMNDARPPINYQQPNSGNPFSQQQQASVPYPHHPQRPLSMMEEDHYYAMQQQQSLQPHYSQTNDSYGYFDRSRGPSDSRFSRSSAPAEFLNASNFQRSAPLQRHHPQFSTSSVNFIQPPDSFDDYGPQHDQYDDSVFIPEQPGSSQRPGFGPPLYEPHQTQTAPPPPHAPSRPASTRPYSRCSTRPPTPRPRSSSVHSSAIIDNTLDGNKKKKVFTHEHNERTSTNNTRISTGRSQRILSALPSAIGAQVYDLCFTTTGCVTEITIQDKCFMARLDTDELVRSFEFPTEFFGLFHPSASLTIQSNNAETFKTFYDSCSNFAQWGSSVKRLTLRGVLSSNTLLEMTTALSHLDHLRIVASSFSDPVDLSNWLNTLPAGLSTLFVDARPFEGSTFYYDTEKICGWLQHEPVYGRSVTLYTANMCGPRPLNHLLQNQIQGLSHDNVLTVISSKPLCRPLHDILISNDMHYGPTTTHPFYNDVYVSFTCRKVNFTFNIGFSRPKETQ